jgi:hypothetical protein
MINYSYLVFSLKILFQLFSLWYILVYVIKLIHLFIIHIYKLILTQTLN